MEATRNMMNLYFIQENLGNTYVKDTLSLEFIKPYQAFYATVENHLPCLILRNNPAVEPSELRAEVRSDLDDGPAIGLPRKGISLVVDLLLRFAV